jgi:hypothetical protein
MARGDDHLPAASKSKQVRPVELSIAVHPELRAELKATAAIGGLTMTRMLHAILCDHLGRPELAGQPPRHARRRP